MSVPSLPQFVDVALRNQKSLGRQWVSRNSMATGVSDELVALAHGSVGRGHRVSRISVIDFSLGPENRLDEFLGLHARTRALIDPARSWLPGSPTRWHDKHASLSDAKTAAPRAAISVRASVVDQCRDESRVIGSAWRVAWRRSWSARRPLGFLGGARRHGRATARARARRMPVKLRHQPVEAVEIVLEPFLGVVHGVAENADRPAISTRRDQPQEFEVLGPLAQRQNFASDAVALPDPCRSGSSATR